VVAVRLAPRTPRDGASSIVAVFVAGGCLCPRPRRRGGRGPCLSRLACHRGECGCDVEGVSASSSCSSRWLALSCGRADGRAGGGDVFREERMAKCGLTKG